MGMFNSRDVTRNDCLNMLTDKQYLNGVSLSFIHFIDKSLPPQRGAAGSNHLLIPVEAFLAPAVECTGTILV